MARLDGKVALILGAATKDNMGQVIARLFAREGAKVVVAGRHEDVLAPLAQEIGGSYALCDITNRAQIFAAVDHTVKTFGKINVGVNCTGWGLLKPFTENTEEELDRMHAIQFKGPFMFFQALIEGMTEGGSIIQMSSATATIMLNNHAAYMGTKAGIDHVIRIIAYEQGEKGIKANSISPGLTETPMAAGAMQTPGLTDAFLKEYPMGRINTADDVANTALWLASDESFVSGQNIHVTGGLTLRRNPTAKEIEASVMQAMAAQQQQ